MHTIRRCVVRISSLVNDGRLDALDGHRRLDYAQRAAALAGRGAHAAGELGEVVGLQQAVQRLTPAALQQERLVSDGSRVCSRQVWANPQHSAHQVSTTGLRPTTGSWQ